MAATTSSVYQTNIPEQLLPYQEALLNQAAAFTDITKNPYQQYQGERVAQLSPLTQQAMENAGQMQVAGQIGAATDIAGAAGLSALGAQYDPMNYYAGSFTQPGAAIDYMSPFMQNVVDVQQREAKRQADIAATARGAQAVRAGAFGGSRQAIENAEANRALQTQLGQIQATGLQSAFQQAQQQFNQEQAARQAAAQMREQSRQFGAGFGMQGLGVGLQAAGQLGQLGQQQFGQTQQAIQTQAGLGQMEQQRAQDVLNAQYQDFLNYQNYPFKTLGFMSDILRGTPLTQVSGAMYQGAPTTMQNLTSLGLGAYGLNQLFKADGGVVGSYADGGSVFSRANKERIVGDLHPMGLPRALQGAMMRGDMETAGAAQDEMSMDAAIRRGIAAAAPDDIGVGYASGGIVAFAKGGTDGDDTADTIETAVDAAEAEGLGQTETNDGSPGNAGLQQRYTQRLMGVIDRMEADKGYVPLTAQERRVAEDIAYRDLTRSLGPDIYAPMRKSLQEQETGRARALEEGKGLAALRAAAAVLSPGGTMRGLGAAGSAFAESYGQALSADKAEKRNIAQMQFNLADAERKERLGLTKEARASVQAAEAAGQAAAKNRREKYTSIANALGRGVQATRPAAARAPGSGPKLNEQLAAAEIAFERNPTEENQKTVTALRRAVAQTKTTDVGPTRATIMGGQMFAKASADVQKIVQKEAFRDQRYLDAMANNDQEAMAAVLDDLTTKQMKRQGVTPGAGTSVSADPLGIRKP